MATGQVQVDGGVGELGMSEKNLDGAQVGRRPPACEWQSCVEANAAKRAW
jgi:hypothetical protein